MKTKTVKSKKEKVVKTKSTKVTNAQNNKETTSQKKFSRNNLYTWIVAILALALVLIVVNVIKGGRRESGKVSLVAGYSNLAYENHMKINKELHIENYDVPAERSKDVKNSRYFGTNDWYNEKTTDSLSILSHFKTYQQKVYNTCGESVIYMILDYFGISEVFDEERIGAIKSNHSSFHDGTCVNQLREMLTTIGLDYVDNNTYKSEPGLSNYKVGLTLIETLVKRGYPVIVGWNKWGGFWNIVIGYENMGTLDVADDILIMADSYDISDHCQDGYTVCHASEFFSQWNFGNFFINEPSANLEKSFIAVKGLNKN